MDNKFIITIERINENKLKDKAKFEIAEDSDLWEWKYVFVAILSFISFGIEQIQELFEEEE